MVPGTIHSYTCVFSISTLITIIYQIQRLRAIFTRTHPEIVKHTLKPSWHIFHPADFRKKVILHRTIATLFCQVPCSLSFQIYTQLHTICCPKTIFASLISEREVYSSSLFYNNLLYITEWISATKDFFLDFVFFLPLYIWSQFLKVFSLLR